MLLFALILPTNEYAADSGEMLTRNTAPQQKTASLCGFVGLFTALNRNGEAAA